MEVSIPQTLNGNLGIKKTLLFKAKYHFTVYNEKNV